MKQITKILRHIDARDALLTAGCISLCYGLWLAYAPSAFVAFGALCLSLWWIGRNR